MKKFVTILLLCCFPTASLAELKIFPMWEQKQCTATAETFACYTFAQAKEILKLDLELQLKLEKCSTCELANSGLHSSIDKLNQAAALLEESNQTLCARLQEREATFSELEDRDILGGAFPWVLSLVVLVAAGAFVGGWYVGSR